MSSKSGKLIAKVIPVSKIDEDLISKMWNIFSQFYKSIEFESFISDLKEKNDVFLLQDSGDNSLQGFSTVKVLQREIFGKPVVAVFSGDTIVRPEYWGQKALHKSFFKYVVSTKIKNPNKRVYWYLISKGYKTYLLMARNFKEYWPRHDQSTPAREFSILDQLSRERYGTCWKPELGTLKFEDCPGKLKDDVAPIFEGLQKHPDIKFFLEKNPGHAQGDELCCLGLIDFKLIGSYPFKLTKQVFSRTGHRFQRLWNS